MITIRLKSIHLAVALSLLLHATVLALRAPRLEGEEHPFRELRFATPDREQRIHLDVMLATERPYRPPAVALAPVPPLKPPEERKPPKRAAKPAAPEVLAVPSNRAAPVPAPAQRPVFGAAPPAEAQPPQERRLPSASELREQVIAAYNSIERRRELASTTVGRDAVFVVRRVEGDYAEFSFAGWNEELGSNVVRQYYVHRGTNEDIRLAVVRRVIAIIREQVQGDFEWASKRLNRNITLSARPRDSAVLEDFLVREFFVGNTPAHWGQAK